MATPTSVWQNESHDRWFLVPDDFVFTLGSLRINNRLGRSEQVDPKCLAAFELSEDQARQWAREELGNVLGDLRMGIDERLNELRQNLKNYKHQDCPPQSTHAVLDLLKALPAIIGQSLSGDEQRVAAARHTMTTLQHRLRESGIDVDDRVGNFADRLAGLRKKP